MTKTQLRALLRRASRQRRIDAEADRLQATVRAEYLHQPPLVEDALGRQALALLRRLDTSCANADELAGAVIEQFEAHPDAPIIASRPGLGALTGARVLAEIGDDRSRFADARALKAYAGAAPVTRASRKSVAVMHRRIKNHRLADAGYRWAFTAPTASPGARAHYDRPPVTTTPPRNATCSTGSSAACTTGWPPASPTKRPSPSHARRSISTPQLDTFASWDVYITRELYRTLTATMTPTTNNSVII